RAIDAHHVRAGFRDSGCQVARATTHIQDALARLGIEQVEHAGGELPDKGMLVVIKSRVPLRILRHAMLLPFREPLPFPFPRIRLAPILRSHGPGSRWTPENSLSHPSSCRAIHEFPVLRHQRKLRS